MKFILDYSTLYLGYDHKNEQQQQQIENLAIEEIHPSSLLICYELLCNEGDISDEGSIILKTTAPVKKG